LDYLEAFLFTYHYFISSIGLLHMLILIYRVPDVGYGVDEEDLPRVPLSARVSNERLKRVKKERRLSKDDLALLPLSNKRKKRRSQFFSPPSKSTHRGIRHSKSSQDLSSKMVSSPSAPILFVKEKKDAKKKKHWKRRSFRFAPSPTRNVEKEKQVIASPEKSVTLLPPGSFLIFLALILIKNVAEKKEEDDSVVPPTGRVAALLSEMKKKKERKSITTPNSENENFNRMISS